MRLWLQNTVSLACVAVLARIGQRLGLFACSILSITCQSRTKKDYFFLATLADAPCLTARPIFCLSHVTVVAGGNWYCAALELVLKELKGSNRPEEEARNGGGRCRGSAEIGARRVSKPESRWGHSCPNRMCCQEHVQEPTNGRCSTHRG